MIPTPQSTSSPTKLSKTTERLTHKTLLASGYDGFDMEKVADDFLNYILSVASGGKTNTEKQEIRDMAIFKDGVTL